MPTETIQHFRPTLRSRLAIWRGWVLGLAECLALLRARKKYSA